LREPKVNDDGSVDVYFGQKKPDGVSDNNWIKTNPKKGFFAVFRFYGPLEPFLNKTWMLNDIEILK